MSFIGNIIWFVLGGFIPAMLWLLVGLLWSVTIIGIPIGVQCFKMANLQLAPFGRDVAFDGMGLGSLVVNILWIMFGGIELAMVNVVIGVIFCLTIVGIPFGLQSFKLAKLSLLPFGARIVAKR
ncbi:MAG TPA: YccF domain-containing protein [Clostridiaceae bacterium]|nr:YccF domain-containing protein [Clostridiaceae bacterium]